MLNKCVNSRNENEIIVLYDTMIKLKRTFKKYSGFMWS